MATDLRIILPNRPGTLVQACEALAEAGINVEGAAGDLRPGETWGYLHVLVQDSEPAKTALERAGYEVASAHEVEVIPLENRPGSIAETCRKYSDAGENLEVLYTAGHNLVVGSERMRREVAGRRMSDARYD